MKLLKEHSSFLFILFTCALLRFLPLFDYQFTYDELSGMERTQFHNFSELIEKGVKIDAHPALVQIIIFYLTQWFGYITWMIKLPFLLFSLGAVAYAYAFGLRNFSKQSGLIAASVFSFSLIFVFYAPIARMYIAGVFFSLALLFYFFEIIFHQDTRRGNYVLFGLFALLSAINHHINALFALTVCISGLFLLNKQNYKAYFIICILVILAYLPNLPVTLYQLGVGGIGVDAGGWLEVPEHTVIFSFLRALFGTGKTWMLIFSVIIVALVMNRGQLFIRKQIYLLLLFIFNFIIVYGYTVLRSPVFQYSVMMFSATALVLLASSFIQFKNRFVFSGVLILLSLALIYKTYIKKDYFSQCVKTTFEYQFGRTDFYKKLYGEKNVYPIFFDADNIMKRIYFEKYHTNFDCKISSDSMISNMQRTYYTRNKDPYTKASVPGQRVSSMRLFAEFVAHLNCDYLVITSSMPQHQAVVKEYFPYLLENTQTQGINFKLYSRKQEDAEKVVEDDQVAYHSSWTMPGKFDYPKMGQVKTINGLSFLKVDSLNEFPFDAKTVLHEVTDKEGQVVLIEAKVRTKTNYSPLELCVSLTDNKTNQQYAYNSKAASDFVMNKDSLITIYSEHFNGTHYYTNKYKSRLNCYLWNRGKESFELLDFQVRVINYWSRKWELWD